MVIAPVRRAGDPGSNPGPGENFSLKALIGNFILIQIEGSFITIRERGYDNFVIVKLSEMRL